MESLNPKKPKFSINTNFQTALPALLANGAAIDNAKVLSSEYSGYLQSCAETANRSLLAALFMMNRLAEVNRQAAAHCRVDFQEAEDALRDLTAVVSETSPVLMDIAVDLACARKRSDGFFSDGLNGGAP